MAKYSAHHSNPRIGPTPPAAPRPLASAICDVERARGSAVVETGARRHLSVQRPTRQRPTKPQPKGGASSSVSPRGLACGKRKSSGGGLFASRSVESASPNTAGRLQPSCPCPSVEILQVEGAPSAPGIREPMDHPPGVAPPLPRPEPCTAEPPRGEQPRSKLARPARLPGSLLELPACAVAHLAAMAWRLPSIGGPWPDDPTTAPAGAG
eukprot:scaffold29695_cov101-Isochrysis_galbana.AAC.1